MGTLKADHTARVMCGEEAAIVDDFGERYRSTSHQAALAVERSVLGSDFGASGYTTVDQVEQLMRLLPLGPGRRLLDIGAGCGWPALYLSINTQCTVTATDLPLEGLCRATARATQEGIAERVSVVRCSARGLPFGQQAFDVIVHSDVLC